MSSVVERSQAIEEIDGIYHKAVMTIPEQTNTPIDESEASARPRADRDVDVLSA